MVASEQTLPDNAATVAGPPTTTQRQYSPLPSVFRAIEYNLPPNYRRLQDTEHGYHWIYESQKPISAREFIRTLTETPSTFQSLMTAKTLTSPPTAARL